MLTISAVNRSEDATRYYSQDNYYTQDEGIEHSQWLGAGAEQLKLSGRVDPEVFAELLNGRVDGEQLGRRTSEGVAHRPGWDLTFSAPKSVSILSEVFDVAEVRDAHQKAVAEALAHVENRYLESRLSVNGQVIRLPAKEGVFATFTHDVSRELDPQLHTHAVLLNATPTPHGWRSIANEKLMDRNAIMEAGMAYRMVLANELSRMGFTLRQHRDPTLWEIDGIPDSLMSEFSKRASQIEDYFESRGLAYDSAHAKQVALLTRKRKRAVPREELSRLWKERAKGHRLSDQILNRRPDPSANDSGDKKTVRDLVKKAVAHLHETDMAFSELELKHGAMKLGLGDVPFRTLDAEIQRLKHAGRLIAAPSTNQSERYRGVEMLTTPQAKATERQLVKLMNQDRGSLKALVNIPKAERFLEKTTLNDQQKAATLKALQSRDRFYAIQGDPGVGKTTTLKIYKQLLEKRGYRVFGMAPSYQAVGELSKSLSIPGMTVDRYLVDTKAQNQVGRFTSQVWIVDEASMLDTKKINQLMAKAQEKKARVLFVGDHQQLESVGAGRGFKHLQEAGIGTATIDKRMRQKTDDLKAVVDLVMSQEYGAALNALNESGRVVASGEKRDGPSPVDQIASEYLSRDPARQRNTLLVAPTNDQRQQINRLVRAGLKAQGQIAEQESSVIAFSDVRLSDEEKKLSSRYQPGQYVRFNHRYSDPAKKIAIQRHEYFQVIGKNEDTNALALKSEKTGKSIVINPAEVGASRSGGLQVLQKEQVALSKGDRIRWLDNNNDQDLKRNMELMVDKVSGDRLRLKDAGGKRYDVSLADYRYRHFEHDYARTAYGVQGKTSREVLAVMESQRQNTVNQRSFMVSLTRASHDVKLFVDDSEKLGRALERRTGDNTQSTQKPEFNKEVTRHAKAAQEQVAGPRTKSRLFKLI